MYTYVNIFLILQCAFNLYKLCSVPLKKTKNQNGGSKEIFKKKEQ